MTAGLDMRATPPWARMSAGTRSSAITAQAPASSAILAWSALVTSMITPPLSISARPVLTRNVARSGIANPIVEGAGRLSMHDPDEPASRRLPDCREGNLWLPRPKHRPPRRVGVLTWGPIPPDPGASTAGPDRPPGLWSLVVSPAQRRQRYFSLKARIRSRCA